MKNSEINWCGNIPEEWCVCRAKDLFRQEHRPVRLQDEIITAFRDGEVTLRKNRRITGFTEATDYSTYQGIRKGDLVIHQMDAFAGCAGISDSDGMGSPILSVCTARKNETELRYFSYLVRLMGFNGYILSLAKGIRERSSDFRFEMFGRQALPVPSSVEQRAIAAYLDEKCGKVDERIKLLEKKVEAYKKLKRSVINEAVTRGLDKNAKLKDSGVDWIGMVPERWEVSRLKDLGEGHGCLFMDGDWINAEDIADSGIRYFTSGNVGLGAFKEQGNGYISEETFRRLNCLSARSGDIMISRLNLPVGRACILPDGYEKCVVAVDCVILRCSENIDSRYLVYSMSTSGYISSAELYARGTTMLRITRTQLGNFKVPVPPRSEQQAIADYLDEKCRKIDGAIANIEKQIDAYKRLKRSLINEVVTGKRKIA